MPSWPGVSPDEIVRCVVSLVPTLGVARMSAVVSNLALALGFDVDAALEEHGPNRHSVSSGGSTLRAPARLSGSRHATETRPDDQPA